MKKIIDGKRYNTDTAKLIASGGSKNVRRNDVNYYEETLYLTNNGAWFLAGKGGPSTRYRKTINGVRGAGSKIIPLNTIKTQEWLVSEDLTDLLDEYFGGIIEDA